MKKFLILVSTVCALWGSVSAARPNIVYIMTDQQSANAMSCAGNKDVRTPNMDRLAARGVRFDNVYCALPLSGPSRASMFTGYMPAEIGMAENETPLRILYACALLATSCKKPDTTMDIQENGT